MKKQNKSETGAVSYKSYEQWEAAYLPSRPPIESNSDFRSEPASEIGKMIASQVLQKFSSMQRPTKAQ